MTTLFPQNIKKVLLVQRGHIGDMVCITPTLKLLAESIPGSHIGVLGNSYNIQVLDQNPLIEAFFIYEKLAGKSLSKRLKNGWAFLKLAFQIRRWKPDIAIIACGYYDYHALSTLRKMGIRNVIGYESIDNKPPPKFSAPSPAFDTMHEVQAIAKLLTPLGINSKPGQMLVYPNKAIRQSLAKKYQLEGQKTNLAIHISGRTADKQWGSENFKALIAAVINDARYANVVVIWAPSKNSIPHAPQGDDKFAETLFEQFNSPKLKLIGTRNLAELIATLSLCHLYIVADGGAMHLACASGLGVVALFDSLPNTLNHWHPWQVPNRVLSRDGGQIQYITPDEVLAATESLLMEIS